MDVGCCGGYGPMGQLPYPRPSLRFDGLSAGSRHASLSHRSRPAPRSGGTCGTLPSRRSFTGAGSRDDGGSARPAVARSGVDERGGQDLGAAQGVVAARGLLACGGGIRCEQVSLAGTGVYYFHHSSRCHYLLSAKLAVSAHCGRLCVLLGSVEPGHH
jgi:hypothetical protein